MFAPQVKLGDAVSVCYGHAKSSTYAVRSPRVHTKRCGCTQVNEIKSFLQGLGHWPIVISGHVPDILPGEASILHKLMKDLMTVCMEMCRLSNSMRQDVRSYMTATAEE